MAKEIIKKKTKEELEQQRADIKLQHNFYKTKKKGGEIHISFRKIEFLKLLKNFGIYAYKMGVKTTKYVKIIKSTVEEIDEDIIADSFFNHIKKLPPLEIITGAGENDLKLNSADVPEDIVITITPEKIEEAALNSLDVLFKPKLLNRLIPDNPIEFMIDDKDSKYFFYQNGFTKVTINDITFHDYDELTKCVFIDQILQRNYVDNPECRDIGNFEKFFKNICKVYNKDKSINQEKTDLRIRSLKTIVGYSFHNYFNYKLYMILFTDARLNEEDQADGRTGKTLLCSSLGKMLNTSDDSSVYSAINGKNFNSDDKFKYAKCNLDTKLIHINDMKKYFDIENLFNDITDGVFVKKEHEKGFTIHTKILGSSNKKVKIEGESSVDRTLVFELSEYYSSKNSPMTEFKQWFFSDDWDEIEWGKFDYFMHSCCQAFFKHGLVRADPINLKMNTLLDHTHRDFVKWFRYQFEAIDDDGVRNDYQLEINTFHTEHKDKTRHNKKDLYNKFIADYPDFLKAKYFNQAVFTKWIKKYMSTIYNDKVTVDEIRSSGADYFIFTKMEGK